MLYLPDRIHLLGDNMGNFRYISPSITVKDVIAFKASKFIDEWCDLDPYVDDDGSLHFNHEDQDHIDHELLAVELAPFASNGDTLTVQDIDDPSIEEFEFDGEGRVYRVSIAKTRGDELTRDDVDDYDTDE